MVCAARLAAALAVHLAGLECSIVLLGGVVLTLREEIWNSNSIGDIIFYVHIIGSKLLLLQSVPMTNETWTWKPDFYTSFFNL